MKPLDQELIDAHQFCEQAQKCLSVPVNNLGFLRLWVGAAILAALLVVLVKIYSTSSNGWSSGTGFGMVVALHATTMFTSKLVDEEHHFWYLASLAWLGYLGAKR